MFSERKILSFTLFSCIKCFQLNRKNLIKRITTYSVIKRTASTFFVFVFLTEIYSLLDSLLFNSYFPTFLNIKYFTPMVVNVTFKNWHSCSHVHCERLVSSTYIPVFRKMLLRLPFTWMRLWYLEVLKELFK